ncbi:MAG TPA: hydantoinase/oxoprolinase family protein [Bordetella sp.]
MTASTEQPGMKTHQAPTPIRVGVEMGGTFTDLVWVRPDGTIRTLKVPSTPGAVHEAILAAVAEAGIDLSQVRRFAHGSTVATNALLTRQGAGVGLITTQGFRDVIQIGTHDRVGDLYNMKYRKPLSPVARRHIHEVPERMSAKGGVLHPLDVDAAVATVETMVQDGIRSIAICLLNSHTNPAHEQQLAGLIRQRHPGVNLSLSSEISPEIREYERCLTTVVNAFVGPMVHDYIGQLDHRLSAGGYDGPLAIMQSNGGIMSADSAGRHAARMLLSGPAAGVRGALHFAQRNGFQDIITLDMGGTSTDVSIARGLQPALMPHIKIDDLTIRIPSLDIVTVGAGGGSIAHRDSAGLLDVGPASAGAYPGPACYGRGGLLPTVSDAQVVAGWLRPERQANAHFHIRADLANQALRTLDLPGSADSAADGVLRIVNNNMVSAVQLVSTARGIDPARFVLVAYGGGGPLHGALVAQALGMRKVLIPWSPGVTSALGLLVCDHIVDLAFTQAHALDASTLGRERLADLRAKAGELAREHALDAPRLEIGLDLHYRGQGYEMTLWLPDALASKEAIQEGFNALHRERYGYCRDAVPVHVLNYRIKLAQPNTSQIPIQAADAESTAQGGLSRRPIRVSGQTCMAVFLPRHGLAIGQVVEGPAIIEESTSTTLVPPGWAARATENGDLLLERNART